MDYKRTWNAVILNNWKTRIYYRVDLHKYRIQKRLYIHRLVAINFIPNPLNLPCVLHKDETLDKNWCLYSWEDNIFWGTHKDNTQDMIKKWRANNHWKNNHPMKWKLWKNNPSSKVVIQYNLNLEFLWEFCWLKEASLKTNTYTTSIWKCCIWKQKTAGWFIWKYK